MSMLLMVEALKAKVGNHGRKLVLIKLADNANDEGECWPSYQNIADHCEMGRSTVKAHIKALAAGGFIQVEERNDGKSSNLYRLTIAKGDINLTRSKSDPVKEEPGQGTEAIPSPSNELTRSKSDPVKKQPGQDSTATRSKSDPLTRSESDPRTSHSFEPVNEPVDAECHPEPPAVETNPRSAQQHPVFDDAARSTDQRFEMFMGWQPSSSFGERLKFNRVDLSALDLETQEEVITEFVSYWATRNDCHSQQQWEHKLIQQVKHFLASPPSKQSTRAKVSASIMNVGDMDW